MNISPSAVLTSGNGRHAWFLWLAGAILLVPTFITMARQLWTTEPGAHGPIVLATGLWLLYHERHRLTQVARAGSLWVTVALLLVALLAYIFSRMTNMLGVECLSVYGAFLSILYYHVGSVALRRLWFPLLYLVFMFPQPETLILPLSRFLKLELSTAAVHLLAMMGYQIGQGGVVIYIDQYELLVATACSGLHSLLGLGAICVFYCYMHYEGSWRDSLPLLLLIVPIALISNFIRVLVLILTTHYFGDRVAQKYVHDFAAFFVFSIAVAMMVGADSLLRHYRRKNMA